MNFHLLFSTMATLKRESVFVALLASSRYDVGREICN